jgi:hypothetical protein
MKDFGLQGIMLHHMGEANCQMLFTKAYWTSCYLVLPSRPTKTTRQKISPPVGRESALLLPGAKGAVDSFLMTSFIDTSSLVLCERDKLTFGRARRLLDVKISRG